MKLGKRQLDLSGKTFGYLTALTFTGKDKHNHCRWDCKCACGKITNVPLGSLTSGYTKSCGCYRVNFAAEKFLKHGHCKGEKLPKVYRCWAGMLTRCYNKNNARYKDWGGRGIKVCEHWHEFENFYADMGDAPLKKGVDRINNDLHYSCGECPECIKNKWKLNCKWSTNQEGSRNRRSNRKLTYNGETKLLTEWAEDLNINRHTITTRLDQLLWSVKEALTVPVNIKLRNRHSHD